MKWTDLPERPWPEATEAPVEQLADWLLSLDREQLEFVLERQRSVGREESECFMRDHEGQIRHLERRLLSVTNVLREHGILPDAKPSQEAS